MSESQNPPIADFAVWDTATQGFMCGGDNFDLTRQQATDLAATSGGSARLITIGHFREWQEGGPYPF